MFRPFSSCWKLRLLGELYRRCRSDKLSLPRELGRSRRFEGALIAEGRFLVTEGGLADRVSTLDTVLGGWAPLKWPRYGAFNCGELGTTVVMMGGPLTMIDTTVMKVGVPVCPIEMQIRD